MRPVEPSGDCVICEFPQARKCPGCGQHACKNCWCECAMCGKCGELWNACYGLCNQKGRKEFVPIKRTFLGKVRFSSRQFLKSISLLSVLKEVGGLASYACTFSSYRIQHYKSTHGYCKLYLRVLLTALCLSALVSTRDARASDCYTVGFRGSTRGEGKMPGPPQRKYYKKWDHKLHYDDDPKALVPQGPWSCGDQRRPWKRHVVILSLIHI